MSSWQKQPVSAAPQVPPAMLTQLPLLMQHGVIVEQVWPDSEHIDVPAMLFVVKQQSLLAIHRIECDLGVVAGAV